VPNEARLGLDVALKKKRLRRSATPTTLSKGLRKKNRCRLSTEGNGAQLIDRGSENDPKGKTERGIGRF